MFKYKLQRSELNFKRWFLKPEVTGAPGKYYSNHAGSNKIKLGNILSIETNSFGNRTRIPIKLSRRQQALNRYFQHTGRPVRGRNAAARVAQHNFIL